MELWQAEMSAFRAVKKAKTLADYLRIGFNRVDFVDKNGHTYQCYELSGDNKTNLYKRSVSIDGIVYDFDANIKVKFDGYDYDEDDYRFVKVSEE